MTKNKKQQLTFLYITFLQIHFFYILHKTSIVKHRRFNDGGQTMSKKVLIIDTSILCVWLKVPGKDT